MHKLRLLLLLSVFSLGQYSCKNPQPEIADSEKQNIILVLVDDLGWTDLSYNGSTFYETPHIDALSKSSFNFTNAYASGSVCSPSRASIVTGKHPVRVNITDWLPGKNPMNRKYLGTQDLEQLPLEELTLAEILKDNNYKTFFSGKWHLGGEGYFPQDQGFDINFGGHHKGSPPGGYYTPYKNPQLEDGPEGEYLTDRLTNESINFINENSKEPFFLMLSFYTVHTPIQANKKHLAKFEEKLNELNEQEVIQKEEGEGLTVLNQVNAEYASMVYAMDENVGRLIESLKSKELYDKSTIIFTSDNGGLSTLNKNYKRPAPTSVLPLRGGKGWLYEGGIRVPLLIKPAGYQGVEKLISEPVVGHDLFTTICKLTDSEVPVEAKIDGQDLSPIFNGDGGLSRDDIVWHFPHYHGSAWTPGSAIRQGDWKLIEFQDPKKVELYNLKKDISESTNLSSSHPGKLKELKTRLHERLSEMNAQHITLNPDFVGSN